MSKVHGLDASADAVAYASEMFDVGNLEFAVADAVAIPLADDSVDVVVTFETIEHIDDYPSSSRRSVACSSPVGWRSSRPLTTLNLLKEITSTSMSSKRTSLHFPVVEEYYRAIWKHVALDRIAALRESEVAIRTLNAAPLEERESLYFYFICSDPAIIETIEPTAALGERYSDRAAFQEHVARASEIGGLRAELLAIKTSRRYQFAERLGNIRQKLTFWR